MLLCTPFNRSILAGHRDLIKVSGEERELWIADGLGGETYCNVCCLWITSDDGIVKLRNILDTQLANYDVTLIVERCALPFTEPIPPGGWLESPKGQKLNIERVREFAGVITLRLNYPVTR